MIMPQAAKTWWLTSLSCHVEKYVFMLINISTGSVLRIRDVLSRIQTFFHPGSGSRKQGVKKAPDPGSGTLYRLILYEYMSWFGNSTSLTLKKIRFDYDIVYFFLFFSAVHCTALKSVQCTVTVYRYGATKVAAERLTALLNCKLAIDT
jgi:hypothetical protein